MAKADLIEIYDYIKVDNPAVAEAFIEDVMIVVGMLHVRHDNAA